MIGNSALLYNEFGQKKMLASNDGLYASYQQLQKQLSEEINNCWTRFTKIVEELIQEEEDSMHKSISVDKSSDAGVNDKVSGMDTHTTREAKTNLKATTVAECSREGKRNAANDLSHGRATLVVGEVSSGKPLMEASNKELQGEINGKDIWSRDIAIYMQLGGSESLKIKIPRHSLEHAMYGSNISDVAKGEELPDTTCSRNGFNRLTQRAHHSFGSATIQQGWNNGETADTYNKHRNNDQEARSYEKVGALYTSECWQLSDVFTILAECPKILSDQTRYLSYCVRLLSPEKSLFTTKEFQERVVRLAHSKMKHPASLDVSSLITYSGNPGPPVELSDGDPSTIWTAVWSGSPDEITQKSLILYLIPIHTTSKLPSFEEMLSTRSMGLRGEALASMTSTTHVTVTTITKGQVNGYKNSYKDGVMVNEPKSYADVEGTQIIVENLFYNMAGRRKTQMIQYIGMGDEISSTGSHQLMRCISWLQVLRYQPPTKHFMQLRIPICGSHQRIKWRVVYSRNTPAYYVDLIPDSTKITNEARYASHITYPLITLHFPYGPPPLFMPIKDSGHNCWTDLITIKSSSGTNKHAIHSGENNSITICGDNFLMQNSILSMEQESLATTDSCMKQRFCTAIHVELPRDAENEGNVHGRIFLRMFGRLTPTLKVNTWAVPSEHGSCYCLDDACTKELSEHIDETMQIWRAGTRKKMLQAWHDIRRVDQSCDLVVFWKGKLPRSLLMIIRTEGIGGDSTMLAIVCCQRVNVPRICYYWRNARVNTYEFFNVSLQLSVQFFIPVLKCDIWGLAWDHDMQEDINEEKDIPMKLIKTSCSYEPPKDDPLPIIMAPIPTLEGFTTLGKYAFDPGGSKLIGFITPIEKFPFRRSTTTENRNGFQGRNLLDNELKNPPPISHTANKMSSCVAFNISRKMRNSMLLCGVQILRDIAIITRVFDPGGRMVGTSTLRARLISREEVCNDSETRGPNHAGQQIVLMGSIGWAHIKWEKMRIFEQRGISS